MMSAEDAENGIAGSTNLVRSRECSSQSYVLVKDMEPNSSDLDSVHYKHCAASLDLLDHDT